MKVLLKNGSPRKEGNTATALAEVAKQLDKEGIESEIVWIGNKPIRGCAACGQCAPRGWDAVCLTMMCATGFRRNLPVQMRSLSVRQSITVSPTVRCSL